MAARAHLGLRLSKCHIVGNHVSRLIYNGKNVSGLDYWLSRELNCEVHRLYVITFVKKILTTSKENN